MIDFVKGHMGGNEIVILRGDQLPEGQELKVALAMLHAPSIRGHEAGILYEGKEGGNLKVKIVGASSRRYITMCGGLTQVLGKALVETDISRYFNITIGKPITKVILETGAGQIPIDIEIDGNRVKRVRTDMTSFANECYELGVQHIKVAEVDALKVGEFLVVNGDEVKKIYSDVNFKAMDEVTLKTLGKIQLDWNNRWHLREGGYWWNFSLYDMHPEHVGNVRAVFPHNVFEKHIEPTCGTGSLTIAIALVELGKIKANKGFSEFLIECGGDVSIGGPDISLLRIYTKNGRIIKTYFSHSSVELLAIGKAYV